MTLFFSFSCQPPEQLLGQVDGGFTVRVMSERRLRWPRIFPREYYRDDQNRPRDRCRPWAMGAGTPVKVSGPSPSPAATSSCAAASIKGGGITGSCGEHPRECAPSLDSNHRNVIREEERNA
jgi:hypothetical protein